MKEKPEKKRKLFVKRSCITGRIIWVYRGSSYEGARKAYWRACKKEVQRVRHWAQRMEERKRQLMRLITGDSNSTSSAVIRSMTPQQRKAANVITRLCKDQPPQGSDFYDHIVEEAHRRNFRSERWKASRERMIRYGQTHVPSDYKPNGKPRGRPRKDTQQASSSV